MKTNSVRNRLTLWYTGLLSLGLVLLSVSVWTALHHILCQELSETLSTQVHGLQEYVRIEDAENASSLAHEIDEYAYSLPSGHLLTITDDNGGLVYRSGPHSDEIARFQTGQKQLIFRGIGYEAMSAVTAVEGGHLRIVLALPSEEVDHSTRLLGLILLALVPAFIVFAGAGGRWLSRRALKPVADITEKARAIGLSNLSERLPVPGTQDEIQQLAETWNDMLARLEVAVSRISKFTADASHELRTPLAIIRLAAENALRRSRSSEDYRAALERIQVQSAGMTRLVEDLLFLARADVTDESGREFSTVDIADLAANAVSDVRPIALQKRLDLETEIPDKTVSVRGDLASLRRLILILLDNAIKYTPEGGRVELRIEENAHGVVLSVRDTGIGISAQNTAHLFDRFFRADPSRNRESGGHGLGLSLAQAIVHAHRAQILVTSDLGSGSTFTVLFPRLQRSPEPEPYLAPGAAVSSGASGIRFPTNAS